jgi:cell division protein FtsB
MSTDKKQTLYDRALDIDALIRLVEASVDEESGEARPITDEDKAVFEEWFNETRGNFDVKFDNTCRFSANLKHEAKIAEAERDSLKEEMDRLSKRAKAANAKAARLRDDISSNSHFHSKSSSAPIETRKSRQVSCRT